MNKSKMKYGMDPWRIVEDTHALDRNEISESIFSLANEYMGIRGNFEEGVASDTLEGCYLGGVYSRAKLVYEWKRKGLPSDANSMIHTTNWLRTLVRIGGETFYMDRSSYSEYERVLDMKRGVLRRKLVWEHGDGCRTALCWEKFVSHADRHLAAIRLRVTALNHELPVTISLALDGERSNQIMNAEHDHHQCIKAFAESGNTSLLMKVGATGQYFIHRMCIRPHGFRTDHETFLVEEKSVWHELTFTPETGEEYRCDKLVSVWTSRDAGHPYGLLGKDSASKGSSVDAETEREIIDFVEKKSRQHMDEVETQGYDHLAAMHSEQLGKLWESGDVEIHGDPAAQQGMRFSLFNLFNTYTGSDPFLNIGAKGLTGEIYQGLTFWDSEAFCLPFYLLTHPQAAQSLVEYRYKTLNGARQRASEFGYRGAMYPMMTIDGTDDCAVSEYGMGEIHICGIMSWAIYQADRAGLDRDAFHDRWIDVLIEVARFWHDRTDWIPDRKGFGINRVTGPDEYQPWINNNFYTNYLAKWAMEFAADSMDKIKSEVPEKWALIVARLHFHDEERLAWCKKAKGMILGRDDDLGIYLQDDSTTSMNPFPLEMLDRERDIPISRKWTSEKMWRHDLIKQPDVLMAMYLFPGAFTQQELEVNYRFYEQRTEHGSSLSPCIHSILAARNGRYEQAYAYYLRASRLDLENANNNTEEGLHISSMAGTWLNVVQGFGGLVVGEHGLSFNPIIPDAWERYSFRVRHQGALIRVSVNKQESCFELLEGSHEKINVGGDEITLTKDGYTAELPKVFLHRHRPKAVVFDLDGVIVDTAKYHYQAWKVLADELEIPFDEAVNERLKGVSRMESLAIILEKSEQQYSQEEMEELASRKNRAYVSLLENLTPADILPGIESFIAELNAAGLKSAIFSSSRNTDCILEKIGIRSLFEVIVTGNDIVNTKPDPEGFLQASNRLGIDPASCVVVEDAVAGVEGAVAAGMKCIGIGDRMALHKADVTLCGTQYLSLNRIHLLY